MASDNGALPTILAGLACLFLYWRLAAPAIDGRRWSVAADLSPQALILAALSVITFWWFLQNILVLLPAILVAIAFHEYGHVIAYRLAGHPSPRFRLVPFGGVAMSDQAPVSQAEQAFISLMGPGFSIALLVGLLLGAEFMAGGPYASWAASATVAAGAVAFLNLLNMAPFYPLDGGRALRSALTVFGDRFANGVAVALCVLFGVLGLLAQSPLLIVIALFGGLALAGEIKFEKSVRPMTIGESILTILTFVAICATHAAALVPILTLLGVFEAAVGAPPTGR